MRIMTMMMSGCSDDRYGQRRGRSKDKQKKMIIVMGG